MYSSMELDHSKLLSLMTHQCKEPLTAISSIIIQLKTKLMLGHKEESYNQKDIIRELNDVEEYIHVVSKLLDQLKHIHSCDTNESLHTLHVMLFEAVEIIKSRNDNQDIHVKFQLNASNIYLNDYDKILEEIVQSMVKLFSGSLDFQDEVLLIYTIDAQDHIEINFCDNYKNKLYFTVQINNDGTMKILENENNGRY